ncbi:MAG: tetratricopeptide repeat protein [Chloroflexi bacterium]|nr:tetratricopeptide repeat protein [Chloroflexota bacterium]
MAAALTWYWDMRGHLKEARDQIDALLAQPEAAPRTMLRARALFAAVGLTGWVGDQIRVLREIEEMNAIAREHLLEGKSILAMGLWQLADRLDANEPERARGLREEVWTLVQDLDDLWAKAWVLSKQAWWLKAENDFTRAHQTAEESLRLFRVMGDGHFAAKQFRQVGELLWNQGNVAAARARLEESLAYFREAKDRKAVMITLNTLGEMLRFEGNDHEAKRCYTEAIGLGQEMGFEPTVPMSNLVWVHLHFGEYEQAKALLRETLASDQAARDKDVMCYGLEVFAALAAAQRQPVRAAQLFGASEQLGESLGIAHNKLYGPADAKEHERNVAIARAQLDEATFNAAWAEGHALTLEQAMALALEDSDGEETSAQA